MRAHGVWLIGGLLGACQPVLPDDGPKDDSGDTDEPPDSDSDSDDGPALPCALPETEPNDEVAQTQTLPMEVRACGDFGVESDSDRWRFELAESGWLALDGVAQGIGSPADVAVILNEPDAGVTLTSVRWMDRPDVRLRVPMEAGRYDVIVRQAVGAGIARGGGPDWRYELRASTIKPPLEHELTEDPTVEAPAVQTLTDAPTPPAGLTLFGNFSAPGDTDTYAVDVPEGRHRLRLTTLAHALGAPSDVALRVVDEDDAVVALVTHGELGWEPDAWADLHFADATRLRVEVIEEGGEGGAGWWYGVRVNLEVE